MNSAQRSTTFASLVLLGAALGACQPSGRCCDPCDPCGARVAPPPPPGGPAPVVPMPVVPMPVPTPPAGSAAPAGAVRHYPELRFDAAAWTGPSAADLEAAKVLHNYKRLSARLARSAAPDGGDADFAALAAAGIKSIVTVDGAAPDVERAKRFGLRYVHIPFGYDGVPVATELELAKTFEILAKDGPILVHCHHGKHRGPAACGIARIVLDGVSNDDVLADMKAAGTDPKYAGLYESLRTFKRPTDAELAGVKADLPEVAPAGTRAAAMASIDHSWDRMKAVRTAKWAVPADHADVAPAHEARILAEGLREFGRRPEIASEPEAFRKLLSAAEGSAWELEAALTASPLDAAKAEAAFTATQQACASCHAQFRDNTHR